MCTTLIDPKCITPLLACHLLALGKNPGVRPIGMKDTARHVIAKAVISAVKDDVLDSVSITQLYVGQIADSESAVHTIYQKFDSPKTDAVILK